MAFNGKYLVVCDCDIGEGLHVTFERDPTPYQLHKVAKRLAGLPNLSFQAYEMSSNYRTFFLLLKKGKAPPMLSRTVATPELFVSRTPAHVAPPPVSA